MYQEHMRRTGMTFEEYNRYKQNEEERKKYFK